MFVAKNNAEISKMAVPSKWDNALINKILHGRRIINGTEAAEIMKFKPLETNIETLFVTKQQLSNENYVKIANECGKTVFPEITPDVRAENIWTPTEAINICLEVHGFDTTQWNDGVLILTNNRSGLLSKIYACEAECLTARNIAAKMVTEQGASTCVFVDHDVIKRFTTVTRQTLPEIPNELDIKEYVDLLKHHILSLQKLADSLRYEDPGKILDLSNEVFQKGETLEQLMTQLSCKLDPEKEETKSNIKHLENKVEKLRLSKEALTVEMEDQLQRQENEINQLLKQNAVASSHAKLETEDM